MRDYRSFEPWQEARSVTTTAFTVARSHWKPEAAALFDHLQRAALSVQSSIVLACIRRSKRCQELLIEHIKRHMSP